MFSSHLFKVSIYFILCLCLLLSESFTIVSAQSLPEIRIEQDAQKLFQKGLLKRNEKNYEDAIAIFTQVIALKPNDADAYYQRGWIYAQYAQGKPPQVGELPPGCRKVGVSIYCKVDVTRDWRKDNQEKAIQDLTQAITLNPQYAAAYYQRGLVQEETNKAIADFEQASRFYHDRGLAYLEQDNPTKAAEAFKYSSLGYRKIESLKSNLAHPDPTTDDSQTGGSTLSPNRKKSPEDIESEAQRSLERRDYHAALSQYQEAQRRFREQGKSQRAQQIQSIIQYLQSRIAQN